MTTKHWKMLISFAIFGHLLPFSILQELLSKVVRAWSRVKDDYREVQQHLICRIIEKCVKIGFSSNLSCSHVLPVLFGRSTYPKLLAALQGYCWARYAELVDVLSCLKVSALLFSFLLDGFRRCWVSLTPCLGSVLVQNVRQVYSVTGAFAWQL